MADKMIIAALDRLHVKACFLAELEDLVPPIRRQESDWAAKFVEHPLATLIKWGLIDAHEGFTALTADEVLHVSFDHRVWDVKFSMSKTATAIERALGRPVWSLALTEGMRQGIDSE